MIKKTLLSTLLPFIVILQGLAQTTPIPTDVPNILPPSPTAASLGKYALMGDNLVTGGATTHLDLYTYKTKNLSVPIALDYNSDGIKVDQVATRVGLGWTLLAGGCISRTVVGAPDENSVFLSPPADWPNTTGSALDIYIKSALADGYDTQPDIYNFSFFGNSGRFISINGVITKLEQNNLVITGNINTGFVITTADGVKYTFKAGESTQSIDSSHPLPIKNAWFLTKIEHPEGDIINLTYNTCQYTYLASASQTDIYFNNATQPDPRYTPASEGPSSKKTWNIISTNGVYLSEISSNSAKGGYLKFTYSPRQDLTGDYCLSSISLYNTDAPTLATPAVHSFGFGYYYATASNFTNEYSTDANNTNKRLFLVALNNDDQNYQFSYNDIDNLPPRISYAQDDYGFFNGKNNASMVPQPLDAPYANAFSPYGYGDRSCDWNFAQKGLLNKIVYPTGGYDQFDYEANTVIGGASYVDCTKPGSTINVFASGDSYLKNQNVYVTVPFHVSCPQTVPLNISLSASSINQDPAGEYLVSAALVPAGTSYNGVTTFNLADAITNLPVQASVGQSNPYTIQLNPGDYELAIKVRGYAHAFCSFSYSNGVAIPSGNMEVAGVRVKRITSYDQASNHTNIKRYYYGDLTTNLSSGQLFNMYPAYQQNFTSYLNITSLIQYDSPSDPQVGCLYSIRYYTRFSSSNYFGIDNLTGNHIYYNKVYESNGENFEDGGTEHDFRNGNDSYASINRGSVISGVSMSNSGINSHQEIQKTTFIKNGSTLAATSKTITNYTDDARLGATNSIFVIRQEAGGQGAVCDNPPYSWSNYPYVDIAQYSLYSRWTYPCSITTIQYDSNGLNPVTKVDSFIYNNPQHQLLTSEQEIDSKNDTYTTSNLYPQDNISGLSTDAQAAQASLVTKGIISPVLVQQVNKNGVPLHTTKVNYKNWANGLTLPQSIETQYGSLPSEPRVNFNNYDSFGNTLEQQKANGPLQQFIWDYIHSYITAEATNATGADIAYTSFEADNDGSWSIASASRDATTAVTGSSSYNLSNGAVTKTGLTPGTTYTVSYWLKSTIPLTITGTVGSIKTGRSYNGWTYFEHQITGQNTVTISGSTNIDELRLYPINAQMTTYTYLPLIGISTVNDPKNNITYYDYDAFSRLKHIKDQNGNILKSYNYNYAGASVNYGAQLIYYNALQSGSFTKSNCSQGGQGLPVTYTIPAGTYTSTVSQGDADNQALAALRTDGQANANNNGGCIACDPTNLANKVINGSCQAGTLVYASSAKQPDGTYICSYFYTWSDGSVSQIYQLAPSSSSCPGGSLN